MPSQDWALQQLKEITPKISISEDSATITNGNIKARISRLGKLIIETVDGKVLLEEYCRNRRDLIDPKCSALEVEAREFKGILGTENYHLTMRLESVSPNEKIFGMGQYQQPWLDLKGMDLELAHRNSQASVTFAVSSLGYGLLWNNPAIGRAVFGKNIMSFEAFSTQVLDYWIVAGDSPAQIVEAYADATGKVPLMPEYGLGFWQCKLRYQTQEELLEVAREYKRREIPIDLIVVDFFHWPKQGEWKFDLEYWPDPGKSPPYVHGNSVDYIQMRW
jgi:alpha-D-xyloside xylohydrolase